MLQIVESRSVLRIKGGFDASAAARLQIEIALARGEELELDFSEAASLETVSVALLARVLRYERRRRIRIVGLRRDDEQLLGVFGAPIDDRGRIADDRDAQPRGTKR
jgi:ABC-type transporter Mla MlaB component